MKKFILLSFLALLGLVSVSAQESQGRKYKVYGVAFYNLENLFDTINNNGKYDLEFSPQGARRWDGRKYWSKINNLARAIASMKTATTPMGPAVIGVSEIENRSVLEDLVADPQISKWSLEIVHHDSPDRRGVDVGLLYNPRFFTVEGVTNHRLRIEGYESFRTRDQMCVVGRMAGERLAVIVNHWPSRLGGQEQSSYLREAAAALSKSIADSLWRVDPSMSVIVMGDLNDDPQDKSCAKVLGGKKNAADADTHGFYNPWWKVLDSGVGTLAYKSAWNLFDQIVISGNLANAPTGKLQYWKCEVLNRDFLKDKNGNRQGYPLRTFSAGVHLDGYSDHFPTEIFLRKAVN